MEQHPRSAEVGTPATSKVQVSTNGTPRSVVLQTKKEGAAGWTTAGTVPSDAGGNATLKYNVASTTTQWRVFVPATVAFDEVTSAVRVLTPKTTISGFNSTALTTATGTKVSDTVAVSPGTNRVVKLYYRKAGTTTWVLQSTLVTSAKGVVTLTELARQGTYQWVLFVPPEPNHDTNATTALRSITGH